MHARAWPWASHTDNKTYSSMLSVVNFLSVYKCISSILLSAVSFFSKLWYLPLILSTYDKTLNPDKIRLTVGNNKHYMHSLCLLTKLHCISISCADEKNQSAAYYSFVLYELHLAAIYKKDKKWAYENIFRTLNTLLLHVSFFSCWWNNGTHYHHL